MANFSFPDAAGHFMGTAVAKEFWLLGRDAV
jgi:hypothetical protein